MDELIGRRSHITATCDMIVSIALPAAMRRNVRELHALHVPEEDRRKGYASQLLHDICREADEHHLTLMLSVEETDKERLAEWYTRFGFWPIQVWPLLMARMPGASPRVVKPISIAARAALH